MSRPNVHQRRVAKLTADLVASRARVEELERALRPFVAKMPRESDLDALDDDARSGRRALSIGPLTFNEMRALLAALKPSAAKTEPDPYVCGACGRDGVEHKSAFGCPSAAKETT